LQDFLIPEAQDPPTLCPDVSVALVIGSVRVVLATVGLDYELGLKAGEVSEVWRYRMLSAEVPVQLFPVEQIPEA